MLICIQVESLIVDIDQLQSHGKISVPCDEVLCSLLCRHQRCRHHQTQTFGLLHRRGTVPFFSYSSLDRRCLIFTHQAVHAQHSKHLLKIRGFSEVKVEKVKEAVKKCLVCRPVTPYHHAATDVDAAQWSWLHDQCRPRTNQKAMLPHLHRQQTVGFHPQRRLPVMQHKRSLWRIS